MDVETDSQQIFYSINSTSFNSTLGLIIDDIKEVASQFSDVRFLFAKRSANWAAYTVAREAAYVSCCGEWFYTLPIFLIDILNSDLMD